MRRLFMHLGFPKTATTTLQNHLFAKHSQINYLGKPFPKNLAGVERDILTLDSFLFEQRLPSLQRALLQDAASVTGEDLVISHEGFLRNTRYGGHDLGRTARRLRAVFGGALGAEDRLEVIIVLRNQVDLMLSHYVQFIKGSQTSFDRYIQAELEAPLRGFSASLFYDELLSFYAAEFGRENLHVLLFEDLVRDTPDFAGRLSEILGIDPAESQALLKGRHGKRKRRHGSAYAARGRGGLAKRLYRAVGASVSVRPKQRAAIEALYARSNACLQTRFGLPLERRGYALEGVSWALGARKTGQAARRDTPRPGLRLPLPARPGLRLGSARLP